MQYLVKPLVSHSGNSPLFYQENARPNTDRTYVITSVASRLVLSQPSEGTITQQKWTESKNQQWKIVPLEYSSQYSNADYYLKGSCKIECVANQRVLEVPGSDMRDNALLGAGSWGDHTNQKWRLVELDRGVYRIENVRSGKVIEVPDNSIAKEGTRLQQYTSADTKYNQQWILSEVRPCPDGALFNKKAIVYKNDNFNLPSQELGLGKYNSGDLEFGNNEISSVRVPEGLRVLMYAKADFKGEKRTLTQDYDFYANEDEFNDKTSAIVVEEVATFYDQPDYQGMKLILGIGRYKLRDIDASAWTRQDGTEDSDINWSVEDNSIDLIDDFNAPIERHALALINSMKVPPSLMVTLYEDGDFNGAPFVFNEDVPDLDQYKYPNDVSAMETSSIIIKAIGIVIPKNVLNFGDTISLKSTYDRWLSGISQGDRIYQQPQDADSEKFTLIRAGDTKYDGIVSYGDIIALKNNAHNKYLGAESNGYPTTRADQLDSWEKFVIVRAGATESNIFVCKGDKIGLRSLAHNRYLHASDSFNNWIISSDTRDLDDRETWTIDTESKPRNTPSEFGTVTSVIEPGNTPSESGTVTSAIEPGNTPSESGTVTSVCGLEACANDICGAAACGAAAGYATICGADACAAAACGVAGSLVSACGVAASGLAVCGADFVGIIAVSGASACGAAVAGLAACGADACGAAACGAAACGAAACGAAACGGDACGAAASGIGANLATACGADVGGIDLCSADACGANACAINLCPADACAADACIIDLIPIIPGI
jgi:hypothetical protein